MKLRKRIKGKENYYCEMDDKDEIHIVNKDGIIVASMTMRDDGSINYWRNCKIEEVEK